MKWIDRGHVASKVPINKSLRMTDSTRRDNQEYAELRLIECAATWTTHLINVADTVQFKQVMDIS